MELIYMLMHDSAIRRERLSDLPYPESVKQINVCIFHLKLEPYVFSLTYMGSELSSGVMGILCSFPSTTTTINSPSAAAALVEGRSSLILGWVAEDGASSIGPATSRNTNIVYYYKEVGEWVTQR